MPIGQPGTTRGSTPPGGTQRRTYAPGSPEWQEALENILMDALEESDRRARGEGLLSDAAYMNLLDAANQFRVEDEKAYNATMDLITGVTQETGDDLLNKAIADLAGIIGGAGGAQPSRLFVQVPTPEEFLNTFETALATHVRGLAQSGAISKQAALWATDNPEMFLNDYMGELGTRAARGEDIFKISGLGLQPIKVGEQTLPAPTGAAAGELAAAGGTAAAETAEILRVPTLEPIFAYAPLDFLKEQFSAKSMMIRFEGMKGMRARTAQIAAGGPPVFLPRRVT